MIRTILIVALVALRCSARTVDSALLEQQIEEDVQIGAVEVYGTIDKDNIKDSTGGISVEVYPFKVGILRDNNQQMNILVLMDRLFTLGSQSLVTKWGSQVGQKSIQTKLDCMSSTLPGQPAIKLQGGWDYQDTTNRNGELDVSLASVNGKLQFKAKLGVDYDRNTTLNAAITLGPVTVTLTKDKDNHLDEYVNLDLPSLKLGKHTFQLAAGAHQDQQRQKDFFISTDAGIIQGRINIDSSVNIDVTGGVAMYNYENDGIQLKVTHYHTNQNEFNVKISFWEMAASIAIDKDNNRVASITLDFDFVKFNVNIGKDGKAEYQATVTLDPLVITGKGDVDGLVELSLKLLGGNEYLIYFSSNLDNKYSLDLVVFGQALSFKL